MTRVGPGNIVKEVRELSIQNHRKIDHTSFTMTGRVFLIILNNPAVICFSITRM